ncbi:hypothetical protein X767_31390 [Mesorhizobium sp. LSJC264A00]|nr:hypothetical protein X767_31390 [Mesorhizobium sp. LSJC264A00]
MPINDENFISEELLGSRPAFVSAQSWRELLVDVKRRGLQIAPDLVRRRRRAWLLEWAR